MTQLRCTSERGVVLRPVRASAAIEAHYYRALAALIREMHESVTYWISATYKQQQPTLAQDALSPAAAFQGIMNKVTQRWRKKFDKAAETLAEGFVKKTQGHAERGLMDSLKKAGLALKFKPSKAVKATAELAIRENAALIKSIPERYLSDVNGLVLRSAMAGGDLKTLTDELQNRYGLTRKRAAFIARDQNNKCTSAINRQRQITLGIVEAEWAHSHGGKHPRASHVKAGADKLRYTLSEGALIDGERIWPGELPNCRCVSRPIIPGFND